MADGKRKRRLVGEINIVPYIDVMLVLLVIFMITTPLLMRGVEVDLPKAEAEALTIEEIERSQPIVVSVDAEGRLYLNISASPDAPMPAADIRERVAAVLSERPGTPVMVQGDRSVAYGQVVEAMVLLQQAGAPSVGLMTEPIEELGSG